MSNASDEPTIGVSDEDLPDDLVPSEDNPLAEGLEDGETVGDLLEDGKHAEQSEQDQDSEESAPRDESDTSQQQ